MWYTERTNEPKASESAIPGVKKVDRRRVYLPLTILIVLLSRYFVINFVNINEEYVDTSDNLIIQQLPAVDTNKLKADERAEGE